MLAYYKTIIAIKFRLNICPKCGKSVKSIKKLIEYINAYKILVVLTFCLLPKLKYTLKYNKTFNSLDIPLDNNKKNLRLANINKQKSAILSDFIL